MGSQDSTGGEWKTVYWVLVALAPVAFFLLSLVVGRHPVSPAAMVKILTSRILDFDSAVPDTVETVLLQVRIPRIAAAMLIGGALSVSGASFQGLFRNPLVSPYILGVASSAGFGASLAILMVENAFVIQLSAFVFGALAVLISYGMTACTGDQDLHSPHARRGGSGGAVRRDETGRNRLKPLVAFFSGGTFRSKGRTGREAVLAARKPLLV